MSEDIQTLFFSNDNQKFAYDLVRNQVLRHNDYDINKNQGFKQNFQKMSLLVYETVKEDERNLVNLNNILVEKGTSFFNKTIEKKLQKKQQMLDNNNLNGNLTSNLGSTDTYMPPNLGTMVDNPFVNNTNNTNNNNTNNDSNSNDEGQGNVLPFTLNNDFSNQINSNEAPLYTNNLSSNESSNPMDLMKDFSSDRDAEMKRYQQQLQNNQDSQNNVVFKIPEPHNLSLPSGNQNSGQLDTSGIASRDFLIRDTKIDLVTTQPQELLKMNDDFTNRMIKTMEENQISGNQVLSTDNQVQNKTLSLLNPKEEEESGQEGGGVEGFQDTLTKAIEASMNKFLNTFKTLNAPSNIRKKEHYITINSIDRKWFKDNSREYRYNFRVNMGSDSTELNTISAKLKNVKSIELVNAILPFDPKVIPFDNRLPIDTTSYPYLVLSLGPGVPSNFHTTTKNLSNNFCQLIFDKEYTSQALSSDLIATDVNTGAGSRTNKATLFNKQFKKGFYKYIPSFFEKTVYVNPVPMPDFIIQLTNPEGEFLVDKEKQNDVLIVSGLENYTTPNSLELLDTGGYPWTNSAFSASEGSNTYLKITTVSQFFTKQFRLGDKIRFNGFVNDPDRGLATDIDKIVEANLVNWLNNEEHYIVNLELDKLTADAGGSRGYINQIFIPFKGELLLTKPGTSVQLDPETLLGSDTHPTAVGVSVDNLREVMTATTNANSTPKLINVSLQTSFTFKITTEEISNRF